MTNKAPRTADAAPHKTNSPPDASQTLPQQATVAVPYEYLVKPVPERELVTTVEPSLHHDQVNQQLRERETDLRTLIANVPGIVYRCEVKSPWRMTQMSEGVLEITGRQPEEFLDGRITWADIVLSEDLPSLEHAVGEAVSKRLPFDAEYRVLHAGGQTRWVQESGRCAYNPDQSPRHLDGVIIDITERILAEEALEAERAELRAVYENAPVMVCVLNGERKLLYANRAFVAYAGKTSGILCPERSSCVLGCELGPQCENCTLRGALSETLASGISQRDIRWRSALLYGKMRREVTMLGSTALIQTAAGSRVLLCLSDVTENEKIQSALRRSEEEYRILVENAGQAIVVVQDGALKFANSMMERITSRTREDLVRLTIADLLHPDDREMVLERYQRRHLGLEVPSGYTFRFLLGDGATVWVHVRAVPIEWEGKPATLNFLSDITEHRQLEADYRTVFESMLDGFAVHEIILDEEGRPADYRFLSVNPAFEKITGLKAEQVVGRTAREVLPGLESGWIEAYGRVALSGEPTRFENQSKELDKWFEVYAFRPKEGQFACMFQDITERKQAEARLQQAQKMESVGRLAGGVAHDFNNLLTVINGYSQLLLGRLTPGDPLRAGLEEIQKAGERAAGLTQQLLAFSRKQVLQPRLLDLNHVVGGMRSMLCRLVGEDVKVGVQLAPDAGVVRADPHQLEQVIMNLVVNARDAMPQGGKLLIETAGVEWDERYAQSHPESHVGRYARLAVSDTGVGMDPEIQRHIFEPFFSTKEVGKGTGLGLATVQGIVAQSGGYIEVYSELGHGTIFKIYLPRLDETVADPGLAEAAGGLRGHETVLLVEDQVEVREYAIAALKAYGYQVVTAQNAGEALLLFEHGRSVDLVLTDVVMPNMSGRELANRLEKLRPGIKVLFMSGYTDDAVAQYGVLDLNSRFIQKPFSPEQLAVKIRKVLGPPTSS